MGNNKRASCFATLPQNELNNAVAHFYPRNKPPKKGSNMGGKTRNIAIQLLLQQYCKRSCTFFVARFTVSTRDKVCGELRQDSASAVG